MRPAARSRRRPAITLLEVIVATMVFLFAMGALLRLSNLSDARAVGVRQKTRATELAESKLGEIVAGVVPLSSQDAQQFDEAPDYQWSMSANPSSVSPGLYAVTVTVTHKRLDGSDMQVAMSRMVLTPSYRGNIAVPAAPPLDSNTQPSSSSSSSSSGSSSSSSSSPGAAAGVSPKSLTSPARGAAPSGGGNRAGTGARSGGGNANGGRGASGPGTGGRGTGTGPRTGGGGRGAGSGSSGRGR